MKKFRKHLLQSIFFVTSVLLGMLVTFHGVANWDCISRLDISRWLVSNYGIPTQLDGAFPDFLKWYGPLGDLVLGFLTEVFFRFLRDPIWVRNSLNFALFPIFLGSTYRLLIKAEVQRPVAYLALCFLFGFIRLGGHALMNLGDFPFACAYLLVLLYMWIRVRDEYRQALRGLPHFTYLTVVHVTLISLTPYLLRPPVLIHLGLWTAIVTYYSTFNPFNWPLRDRLLKPITVLLAAICFVYALWPSIWETGWRGWYASFELFSRFIWTGYVRAWGQTFGPTFWNGSTFVSRLPIWYAPSWPIVNLHPTVLIGVLIGLGILLRSTLLASWRGFHALLTFQSCLLWVSILGWLAVLMKRPVIYDEDRHLLFLFPPVLVLGALGWARMSARTIYLFGTLALLSSSWSYWHWGDYSYVYKSPLIGDRSASRFTGDYWGLCISEAIDALPGLSTSTSEVVVPGPISVAKVQLRRRQNSLLAQRSGFERFTVSNRSSGNSTYLLIANNRMNYQLKVLKDVDAGKAKLLWQTSMPPHDTACIIVEYGKGEPFPSFDAA